ncbi:MAG: hypothetical protein GY861_09940 [bacterium]|nr:hypothetical protein [bacterium]
MKKAQGLSMQTVVITIIALVVLVVLIVIIGKIPLSDILSTKDCSVAYKGGYCIKAEQRNDCSKTGNVFKTGCPEEDIGNTEDMVYCCVPQFGRE